jgi:hypothetical protein
LDEHLLRDDLHLAFVLKECLIIGEEFPEKLAASDFEIEVGVEELHLHLEVRLIL